MAKHLSSRGLTNRLSLTSGRWIPRRQGWRSGRVARAGPKTFQTPVFWVPIRDPRESLRVPMQFIRKQ
jgi:hypothetical protein